MHDVVAARPELLDEGARPDEAFAQERLSWTDDGRIAHRTARAAARRVPAPVDWHEYNRPVTACPGLVIVWSADAPCFRPLAAPIEVGRDLFPDDEALSKRHAMLEEGSYCGVTTVACIDLLIEDLGSRNGTYIEGERLVGRGIAERSAVVRMGHTVGVVVPDVASYDGGVVAPVGRDPQLRSMLGYEAIARAADEAVREAGLRIHASAVAWCLRSYWHNRDDLVDVIVAAAAVAEAAGAAQVRDSHLGKPRPREW